MKKRILMIISLLVVGMTGIAAADQMNIFDGSVKVDNIILPIGGSKDLTLNISEFARPLNSIHNLSVTLYNEDGSAETTGLNVTLEETITPTGPNPGPATCTFPISGCNSIIRWKQSQGPGGFEVLKMKVNETAGVQANYLIEITDKESGKKALLSSESIPVNIPEFPKVALPVAVGIGLVFLVRQKKKKEE